MRNTHTTAAAAMSGRGNRPIVQVKRLETERTREWGALASK